MSNASISLSESAARRVEHFIRTEGGIGLRLGVRKTGCSGWAYEVGLATDVTERDAIFEDRGVRVVVDQEVLPMVAGTRIDFVQQGLNRMFEFENPNVTDECGCGESFTIGGPAG